MTTQEIVQQVVNALEGLGVPYMLVGSFSSNAYGVARNTQDADFVIQLGSVSMTELMSRLGPAFRLDPQMSFETITATHRYLLDVAQEGFTVELFLVSDDPYDRERFDRRRRIDLPDGLAYLLSAEDVVITKLRWSKHGQRQKDIDDARNVMAVSGKQLDWPYIERWCDEHGTRTLLDDIRRSISNL